MPNDAMTKEVQITNAQWESGNDVILRRSRTRRSRRISNAVDVVLSDEALLELEILRCA